MRVHDIKLIKQTDTANRYIRIASGPHVESKIKYKDQRQDKKNTTAP